MYWPPFSRTPGNVAFDVAGIERRFVEGRIEQLNQSGIAPDQALIDGVHRLTRALRIAGAAEHRPALRQRIDLAFRIGWRSRAVRRCRSRRGDTIGRPRRVARCFARSCRASLRQRSAKATSLRAARQVGKLGQHVVEEERQPDAFAAALLADQVHAIVPIAATHQRQAVIAEFQSVLDGADAMLVKRGRFLRSDCGKS